MTTELRRLYLSVEHDAGITDVRIGVTEFNRVGGVPLQGHAHVFLPTGDDRLFAAQSARPYSTLIQVSHHCGLGRKVG